MENLLTRENLEAGIRFWCEQKTNWPADFHNQFYQDLSRLKDNGLSEAWWSAIVNYLSGWKAIRPLKKAVVCERGMERLGELQTEYTRLTESSSNVPLSLQTVEWDALEALYNIAFDIKGVNSPVFGSKLCHFLLPNVYPVIDQDVIGVNSRSYEDYWRFCKAQWGDCEEKVELVELLRQKIGMGVTPDYPFLVKVTELCIIGSRNGNQ